MWHVSVNHGPAFNTINSKTNTKKVLTDCLLPIGANESHFSLSLVRAVSFSCSATLLLHSQCVNWRMQHSIRSIATCSGETENDRRKRKAITTDTLSLSLQYHFSLKTIMCNAFMLMVHRNEYKWRAQRFREIYSRSSDMTNDFHKMFRIALQSLTDSYKLRMLKSNRIRFPLDSEFHSKFKLS